MSHHTTSPAVALAKAGTYDPEKVANLEATIEAKILEHEKICAQHSDALRQRRAGRRPTPPAWFLWRKLDRLEEELELLLSDLDRRRI